MDDTELRDDLARSLEPPDEEVPPALDPLDEDRANQMLFKVRRLARDRSRVQAVAGAERDRVDAWERDRLKTIDDEITHLTTTLEQWMRMHEKRTKAVTKKLPNGELKLRPAPARLEVTDHEKINAFAIERVMASIARNLVTDAFKDRKLTSEDVWSLAFSHLMAEPFLRVKVELAKDVIKKAAIEGEVASEHEDLEMRHALLGPTDAREIVPGVKFERSKHKNFGMTLASASGPDVDAAPLDDHYDEEVDRG